MKSARWALLFAILAAGSARAEWEKLENVAFRTDPANDGDSFHVAWQGRSFFFRLYFVDCPETQDRLKDRIAEQAQVEVAGIRFKHGDGRRQLDGRRAHPDAPRA